MGDAIRRAIRTIACSTERRDDFRTRAAHRPRSRTLHTEARPTDDGICGTSAQRRWPTVRSIRQS